VPEGTVRISSLCHNAAKTSLATQLAQGSAGWQGRPSHSRIRTHAHPAPTGPAPETPHGSHCEVLPQHRKGQGPAGRPRPDREAVRQGFHHAPGRRRGDRGHPGRVDRLAGPGHRTGGWRFAAWSRHRNLWPGILRQNDADLAGGVGNAEAGRRVRLHRRRARARCAVRPETGGQPAGPADLAARHRRAGPGNRRRAGAFRLGRPHRGGLGGRVDPEGRTRRRNGRCIACKHAS